MRLEATASQTERCLGSLLFTPLTGGFSVQGTIVGPGSCPRKAVLGSLMPRDLRGSEEREAACVRPVREWPTLHKGTGVGGCSEAGSGADTELSVSALPQAPRARLVRISRRSVRLGLPRAPGTQRSDFAVVVPGSRRGCPQSPEGDRRQMRWQCVSESPGSYP